MTRRRISNPLALAVLCLLLERPMHPYEMSTTLRERGKEDSIKLNYGSLYAVVESLVRHGYIVARETVREGRRPERTIYELTPAGHEEYVSWMSELLAVPTKEYPRFEAALSLIGGIPPEDALALLDERAMRLELALRARRSTSELAGGDYHVPRLFLIEGEYHDALLEAELKFVRGLAADIRNGSLEGIEGWRSLHAEGEPEGVTPLRKTAS
jgi:DNA-binding PadR family transcriptional regulator